MDCLQVGPCDIVLHVRPCEGLVRQLDGSIEKRWAPKELACPIQARSWLASDWHNILPDSGEWLGCLSHSDSQVGSD